MIRKLSEVTDIYLGQPIRDKIENTPSGDYFIVQMKDVTKDSGVKAETLYKTNLKGRTGNGYARACGNSPNFFT